MTNEERLLFDKLNKDREDTAKALEKPSTRNYTKSVTDKYTDQAHFIYELLQNADDAGATEASFDLHTDKLIFIHNGTKLFDITDVDTEDEDSTEGYLGNLNSITSIANSNKTESSIGKFGVGFKAVFQYTLTPLIYDPNISFKIERFIVPVLIEDDFNGREENQTAFVFPFNNPEHTESESYDDISYKLKNLVFSTLFLNNLKKITYQIGLVHGKYEKIVNETRIIESTTAERLELITENSEETAKLWLFSRLTKENYRYSVGFFYDEEGKLKQTDYYAFCFFPTKKKTNLNFIINAPFLLNDSREGIRANVKHNVRMIELLAKLSADSFVCLRDLGLESGNRYIDDDILEYLPINEKLYTPKNDRDDISLKPFFEEIKNTFSIEKILPSFTDYVEASNAYAPFWANISELFSNDQLAELVDNADAKWVIPSKGYATYYQARDGKSDYLRSLIRRIYNCYIEDVKIIELLTAAFIEKQSKTWILKLYDFILETDKRLAKARTVPIFIDKNGKPTAAFDENGVEILFLDEPDSVGYNTISSDYINEDATHKLIERYNIKAPELKDKIYNKILKKDTLNPKSDCKAFLDYYIELIENDGNTYDFIRSIRKKQFVLGISEDGTNTGNVYVPEDLYYPTDDLKLYFQGTGEVLFVDIKAYEDFMSIKELKYIKDFLQEVGVSEFVKIHVKELTRAEAYQYNADWKLSSKNPIWLEYRISYDEFVLNKIGDNNDTLLSILLWSQLVNLFENGQTGCEGLYYGGVYKYFFRTFKFQAFDGEGTMLLRERAWLFNKSGMLNRPSEITVQDLDSRYDIRSNGAKRILDYLGIIDAHPEYEKCDDETKSRLALLDEYEKMGLKDLTPDQKKELEAFISKKLLRSSDSKADTAHESTSNTVYKDRVINDLKSRLYEVREKKRIKKQEAVNDLDNDEITKAPVDYSKKIEQAKTKFEEEVSQLAHIEETQEIALKSIKYSYGWFKALLELEALANGDENARSREVAISFARVEREPETNRTLILKHPDKNIPQVMEELVDIPLELTFSDGMTKRLVIEVANVQSYTLRVKVKPNDFLNEADFSLVTQALIVARNPNFLTRELQKQFAKFAEAPYNFDDDYDMQQNLCDNIRFIFGPPGTGKTTYLANNTLIPLINNEHKCRVLVLAPTNKAADVLVQRIIHELGDDESYSSWLIRYGVTGDEEIEKSDVFHGKKLEINDYDRCVVVTTMARLPYDYFIDSDGNFNYLHGINWDYIVVDEASMIPLIQMVYLLYLKTPRKFIIAGDPFQIEPTTSVSEWKSENIYKMVHLEEFSENANTVPHKYEITLLTTQYRSIESVGEVFSQFTYNGVLKHARSNKDAKTLNIEKYLEYANLNIIKFPVSKYESIYKAKRLKLSNFHIYSALFTYEFVIFLAKALAMCNKDTFRIGVIAPYSAQAGIIDKLIATADIPDTISISVGTIHGFQGDECDIVLALFNPPPGISTNRNMFLNKQNIINVAISRAKDYLFVLMPDEETDNVHNLFLINKLRKIIEKDSYVEKSTRELESLLFDNGTYLEENVFSTGHQLVNVYGLPEKRYEIRSEENAVDVQVHGASKYAPLE